MRCIHCNGLMQKGLAPFRIERSGYILTLQKVPAWICSNCNKSLFDKKAVDSIQEVIQAIDTKAQELAASA